MAVHPAIQAMLAKARAAGVPALSAGTAEDARALLVPIRAALGAGVAVGSRTEVVIPTRGGEIAGLLLRPEGDAAGLVVYLHGGGWVIGAPADFEVLARSLVAQSGCALLLPDYRLAPEHRFPAAVDDALDSVAWAWRERGRLTGWEGTLVVAGDSAGGNLATVVARRLRGQVPIAGQVLIYPVTDADFGRASYAAYSAGLPLSREDMVWFFEHYAPTTAWGDPDIAPLRAGDLAGLPPATVVIVENDVLRDEGEAYAALLREAGVAVTLRFYPGLTHGSIRLHDMVDTAATAVRDVAADLRRYCDLGAERAG